MGTRTFRANSDNVSHCCTIITPTRAVRSRGQSSPSSVRYSFGWPNTARVRRDRTSFSQRGQPDRRTPRACTPFPARTRTMFANRARPPSSNSDPRPTPRDYDNTCLLFGFSVVLRDRRFTLFQTTKTARKRFFQTALTLGADHQLRFANIFVFFFFCSTCPLLMFEKHSPPS